MNIYTIIAIFLLPPILAHIYVRAIFIKPISYWTPRWIQYPYYRLCLYHLKQIKPDPLLQLPLLAYYHFQADIDFRDGGMWAFREGVCGVLTRVEQYAQAISRRHSKAYSQDEQSEESY